ncbi:MAG: hypothetical protein HRO68_06195 [Nitrosopumilus sp.]|nr:hypothetical protein [Nitrosopumilus sp.]
MAEKIRVEEKVNLDAEVEKVKAAMLHKKATDSLESKRAKIRRYIFGPFQFLVLCLIMAESLLVYWMYQINSLIAANDSIFYERIVVGSLSITVLVVFSVVYKIKKTRGDCEH